MNIKNSILKIHRGGRFFGDFFSADPEDNSINDLSRFIFDENIFYLKSNLNKLGKFI